MQRAALLPPSASLGVASLALAMLLSSLGTSIANVGLPAMAGAFDAPFRQVQWIVLSYLLAITTLTVSAGRLGDLFGRRRMLLAGLLLFTLASLLCAAAPALPWLLVARTFQGFGAALMMSLAMAMVGDTVPRARTGKAMGLLGTTSAVGTALGPSLGGVLLQGFGWQALFLAGVPLGLLALALGLRHLPADHPATGAATQRPGFDLAGTLVLAATLAAYALAMTWGRGDFGSRTLWLLLAAAMGVGVFVAVERRAASPLIRGSMLRAPGLRPSLVMSGAVSTVMMATLVVGPFYLGRGLGLGAAGVGLLMALGPLAAALTGVPAGRLVDRFGAPRIVVAGLALAVVGALLLWRLPAALGVAGYAVPLVLLTAGYAMFQTANNTATMVPVTSDRRGVVSGLLNLARNLGLVSGASLMGAVFARAAGGLDMAMAPPAVVAIGMHATFGVAALLLAAALAIALAEAVRQGRDRAAGRASSDGSGGVPATR